MVLLQKFFQCISVQIFLHYQRIAIKKFDIINMGPLAVIQMKKPRVECFYIFMTVHFQNSFRGAGFAKALHTVNHRVLILNNGLSMRNILFCDKKLFF